MFIITIDVPTKFAGMDINGPSSPWPLDFGPGPQVFERNAYCHNVKIT